MYHLFYDVWCAKRIQGAVSFTIGDLMFYDSMWLYMTTVYTILYDYILWLCMILYDDVWLYMIPYDFIILYWYMTTNYFQHLSTSLSNVLCFMRTWTTMNLCISLWKLASVGSPRKRSRWFRQQLLRFLPATLRFLQPLVWKIYISRSAFLTSFSRIEGCFM